MRHFSAVLLLTSVTAPVIGRAQTLAAVTSAPYSTQRAGSVRGVVRTSDGQPAAFVSVGIPKLGKGANTTEDGSFQILDVEPGEHELQVSHQRRRGRGHQRQPVAALLFQH